MMNQKLNNFKLNKSLINDLLVFYKPKYVDFQVVNGTEIVKRRPQDRVYWNSKFEDYLIYYQNKVGEFVKELISKLKELDKQQKIINLYSLNYKWNEEIVYWNTFVNYCTTPNLLVDKEVLDDLIQGFWNNLNELIGEI